MVKTVFAIQQKLRKPKNSVVIDDVITVKVIKYINNSESKIVCIKLFFIHFISADSATALLFLPH